MLDIMAVTVKNIFAAVSLCPNRHCARTSIVNNSKVKLILLFPDWNKFSITKLIIIPALSTLNPHGIQPIIFVVDQHD
ncbi:hypothetical protein Xenpb_03820 [Xenorhabdus sp. PB62.4]|nr:hypothetical protein [Xenorhabdus sp. PB62.4]